MKNPATKTECKVPILNGEEFIVFPSVEQNERGVDYVRFIDKDDEELLYYDKQEWIDDPELIMGCILATIQNGAKNLITFP
jgi:hypothetical protein